MTNIDELAIGAMGLVQFVPHDVEALVHVARVRTH